MPREPSRSYTHRFKEFGPNTLHSDGTITCAKHCGCNCLVFAQGFATSNISQVRLVLCGIADLDSDCEVWEELHEEWDHPHVDAPADTSLHHVHRKKVFSGPLYYISELNFEAQEDECAEDPDWEFVSGDPVPPEYDSGTVLNFTTYNDGDSLTCEDAVDTMTAAAPAYTTGGSFGVPAAYCNPPTGLGEASSGEYYRSEILLYAITPEAYDPSATLAYIPVYYEVIDANTEEVISSNTVDIPTSSKTLISGEYFFGPVSAGNITPGSCPSVYTTIFPEGTNQLCLDLFNSAFASGNSGVVID